MLSKYLKIAFRQMKNNKVFTSLNVMGLALGIAVALLISTFIRHELDYDHWIADSDRVYRVYRMHENATAWTPSFLAQKMINDYPEVEMASGFSIGNNQLVEYKDKKMYVPVTASVDSSFFEVLKLDFLHGDPETVLKELNNMVITDQLAIKIFGHTNPIGEVVQYNAEYDYVISGVINTEGRKSHINSEVYTRFTWYSTTWVGNNRLTYTILKPNANPDQLAAKIQADANELIRQEHLGRGYDPKPEDLYSWHLQPLDEAYLQSEGWTVQQELAGSIRNLYIFGIIALLVLLVAIINYINLATARASQRSKEVGVKKVAGASRGHLITQFLTESVLQSIFAGIIGLLIAVAFLPVFNQVMNRRLGLLSSEPLLIIGGTLILSVFIGILAGVYPAFILSGYQPSVAIKSSFMKSGEKGIFRKVLVTSQFTVSIVLLVVMAFIYRQVNYMLQKDLGFKGDQVLTIPMNDENTKYRVAQLKSRFKQIPGVQEVTTASTMPGGFLPDWNMMIQGREETVVPYVLFADADFDETLDIEVLEGRFIEDQIAADSIDNFFVNEEFVKRYQLDNPIGTKMRYGWAEEYGQIVGVLKDFHYFGLNKAIEPLVMNARPWRNTAAFKLSTTDLASTIKAVEKVWNEIEPTHPMRYSFVDEDFARQYDEQQRFGKNILYATLLTLFIALLGLFGLTAFTVERRTKEIGIRKVLGASVAGIIGLIAGDFLKLLGIAFVLAIPISYLLSSRWMEDFAYHTNLSWWVFLVAGIAIVLVSIFTVCMQSWKTAITNPMESLKTE